MEELLKLAQHLGRKITAHQRTIMLRKAQQAVNEDEQAQTLIENYQQQAAKIRQREKDLQPVEVEDKHQLEEIERKISSHDKLKELTRRQADFIEMMQKVKNTIDKQLEIDQL